jgi:hypothetical protein
MKEAVYNRVRAIQSLLIATRTNGTVNGTTVDTAQFKNYARSASVLVFTGTITDGSHAVVLQESDDNSAWANVGAADLLGSAPTLAAANDDALFEFGYAGGKRYLRVSVTTSGATTGGSFGAVVLLGDSRKTPIARS